MNHENMKMTEVGLIPKDWEVKTLEEIGNFSKGRGVSRDQSHSGNLPCVRYGELYTSHDNYIRNFYSFISQEVADTAKRLNKGDVLFAASGETKEEIGKAVAFVGNEEAYAGGDIIILSPKIESDSMFLGFALNGEESVRQKSALGQGDAVVHIHVPELSKVSIAFPNPSEQRRIAQVLSDTDTLIASLSRTIEKKRLVKQGAMQQLLTGKTRLKGFSGEWVEKELGEFADIYRGSSPRPIESFITTLPDGLNWIKIGDVANNAKYINKTAERIIPEGEKHSRFVRNGDLLLSNSMSFGRPYILRTDGCIHDGWLVIQNYKDEWVTDFLYYLLCSENVLKQYEVLAAGSGVKNLNKAIVSNVVLRYPVDLNEQFAIANILTTMDNEITSLEAELQKYKALKQGMMQKLLTGEIRLPICQTTE